MERGAEDSTQHGDVRADAASVQVEAPWQDGDAAQDGAQGFGPNHDGSVYSTQDGLRVERASEVGSVRRSGTRSVLYITEQKAVLRKYGVGLRVTAPPEDSLESDEAPAEVKRRGDRVLIDFETHRLEQIVLVGGSHATADAVRQCLVDGVGLAWQSRSGRLLGRAVPFAPKAAELPLLQVRCFDDAAARLSLAKTVVRSKTANAAAVLRASRSNEPDRPELSAALAGLRSLAEQAAGATTIASLRGFEGAAAAAYFGAFAGLVKPPFTFGGRRRRPPPDPVNALLSFCYALLLNRLEAEIELRGLLSRVGFLHEIRPGRPSLALDLLEEFRHPIVDRFVLRVCNLRSVNPDDFERDPENDEGVRLTRKGLRTVLGKWDEFLARPVREIGLDARLSAGDLVRRQVDRLIVFLRDGVLYEPLLVEA